MGAGYIAFKLEKRYTVSIFVITREGKNVVHAEIFICIYDLSTKWLLELNIYEREKQTNRHPKSNL